MQPLNSLHSRLRVARLGASQQRLNGKQRRLQRESGAPLVLQNVWEREISESEKLQTLARAAGGTGEQRATEVRRGLPRQMAPLWLETLGCLRGAAEIRQKSGLEAEEGVGAGEAVGKRQHRRFEHAAERRRGRRARLS